MESDIADMRSEGEQPLHRRCEVCGEQPETIYGPDYRFGKDRIHKVPKVYTAQCGARDCYKGVQFSSFTAEKALEMWDGFKDTQRPTSKTVA